MNDFQDMLEIDAMQEALVSALNFEPKRICEPTGWVPHIPVAATLVYGIKPKVIVELGTHSGNSYFAFCQAVQESGLQAHCYAVDTWHGDAQAGIYDDLVYQQVLKYNESNYSNFSKLLRMTFNEAAAQFPDESIDLLHIDGLHTYEAVAEDYATWSPKVRKGGVIVFHDVCVRSGDYGVWKLWNEIKEKNTHTLTLLHSFGLGVLVKDAPQGVEAPFLSDLTKKSKSALWQSLFAKSGENILAMREVEKSRLLNAQVFVSNDGNYDECKSEKITYERNKLTVLRFTTLSRMVRQGPVHLRIDPIAQIGDLSVKRISLLYGAQVTQGGRIREYDFATELTLNENIICIDKIPLNIISNTEDPQILLAPFSWDGQHPWMLEIELIADPLMSHMGAWLKKQSAHLVDLQKQAFAVDQEIQERDNTILHLRSNLETQQNILYMQLQQSEQFLADKNNTLDQIQNTLASKIQEIQKLEQALQSQIKHSEKLHEDVLQIQLKFNKAQAQIEEDRNAIEILNANKKELTIECERKNFIIDDINKTCDLHRAELHAIKGSLRWKIISFFSIGKIFK